MSGVDKPEAAIGAPETFGWQRRPELDTATRWAYERPDGELMLFPKGRAPKLIRLRPLEREAKG